MLVNLSKNESVSMVNLSKAVGKSLNNVRIGLGWDVNTLGFGGEFDLDVFTLFLDANGKAVDPAIVFFNNPSASGVKLNGDNRTGAGAGDDESVDVNLSQLTSNAQVQKLLFAVDIHEAAARQQTFGMVDNAYAVVRDADNGNELVRYNLTEKFSNETVVKVAELVRNGSDWEFKAVGDGYHGEITGLLRDLGLDVG